MLYGSLGQAGSGSPIIPGALPGTGIIASTGEQVEMKSWNDDVIYDSEQIVTPFAAGNEMFFFRQTTFPAGARKDLRFTNMRTQSQLPSGWFMEVRLLSFRVLQMETVIGGGLFTTAEDVKRLLTEGVVTFRTGNQKIERQLPALMWQSPHGMQGLVTRTGAGWTTWSYVNNGVASPAAVIPLTYPIRLTNELTFEGSFQAPGGLILDNNTFVMMELHGVMSVPLR